MAAASAVTVMVTGKTLWECVRIDQDAVLAIWADCPTTRVTAPSWP